MRGGDRGGFRGNYREDQRTGFRHQGPEPDFEKRYGDRREFNRNNDRYERPRRYNDDNEFGDRGRGRGYRF